jgi:nitrogen regulatory protein PII
MKLITAYIQPHKLNDVKQELYKAEVYKISITNALGAAAEGVSRIVSRRRRRGESPEKGTGRDRRERQLREAHGRRDHQGRPHGEIGDGKILS